MEVNLISDAVASWAAYRQFVIFSSGCEWEFEQKDYDRMERGMHTQSAYKVD